MSKRKKILLIPTTDHTVMSFILTYKGLENEFDVFFILDSVHIKREHDLSWAKVLDVSSIKNFSMVPKWLKFLPLSLNSLYYKLKINEIFEIYKFDYVIVSNDRPLLQYRAIIEARKRNITTITHQVASGIISKNNINTWDRRLKSLIIGFFTGQFRRVHYGGQCDYVFIMGLSWRNIVSKRIPESSVRLISNGFYYYFKSDFIKRTAQFDRSCIQNKLLIHSDKKNIVFFSQPFFEISLFNRDQTLAIYGMVNDLSEKLPKDYQVLFKPHPQEVLYREFKFNQSVKIIDAVTPDESLIISDATLSVSSTMSLQSKLLDIPSYSLIPDFMPEDYILSSKYFFHSNIDTINRMDDEIKLIDNELDDIIFRGLSPEESLRIFFNEIENNENR